MHEPRAPTLKIASIGSRIPKLAEKNDTCRLVAVFSRSVHVLAGDAYGCIGDASIGNGPLNAITNEAAMALIRPLATGAAIRLDIQGASIWKPPPPPRPVDQDRIACAINHLRTFAVATAPAEGLARQALGIHAPEGALTRLAGPRIASLRTWLRDSNIGALPHPPTNLLGMGPGLTPSGDDFLCGVLIALRALGHHIAAQSLGNAAVTAALTATTPLSRAMLAAAADGEAAEALHLTLNDLISGARDTLPDRIKALGRIGHTSGWDALAGATLALDTITSRPSP